MNIIHITPHVGGGVGSVINAWVSNDMYNTHGILCLESPQKIPLGIEKYLLDIQDIYYYVNNSDVVIFHLWNNPAMYSLLTGMSNIHLPDKFRAVAWGHSSGTYPPYVVYSYKIFSYFDRIVFTSPISYKTITKLQRLKYNKKLYSIWSTSGISSSICSNLALYKSEINITYVGSMDNKKIVPWFFDACYDIISARKDIIFHMVGDGPDIYTMCKYVETLGIKDNFIFHGYTNDVKRILAITNIFAYPLSKYHFGTCEQVIGEAMSFGIPIVTTNNSAEKYILKKGYYGLLSNNKLDYVNNIFKLLQDNKLYSILSKRSLKRAKDLYSIDKMIKQWNLLLNNVIGKPKFKKQWKNKKDITTIFDVFLESIGRYSKFFYNTEKDINIILCKLLKVSGTIPSCWLGFNKGTLEHYFNYYDKVFSIKDNILFKLISKMKILGEKWGE